MVSDGKTKKNENENDTGQPAEGCRLGASNPFGLRCVVFLFHIYKNRPV